MRQLARITGAAGGIAANRLVQVSARRARISPGPDRQAGRLALSAAEEMCYANSRGRVRPLSILVQAPGPSTRVGTRVYLFVADLQPQHV